MNIPLSFLGKEGWKTFKSMLFCTSFPTLSLHLYCHCVLLPYLTICNSLTNSRSRSKQFLLFFFHHHIIILYRAMFIYMYTQSLDSSCLRTFFLYFYSLSSFILIIMCRCLYLIVSNKQKKKRGVHVMLH